MCTLVVQHLPNMCKDMGLIPGGEEEDLEHAWLCLAEVLSTVFFFLHAFRWVQRHL
jgi:hypothetical protein